MKNIIYENIIKIITIISINIIFILFNGYENFQIETIAKLNYLLFAGYMLAFALTISIIFKTLFKLKSFTIAITTIVNTTIVAISSVLGMGIYLYFVSTSPDLTQVKYIFISLTTLLSLAIGVLIYISKKVTELKA